MQLNLPNPGYPAPTGVKGGITIPAGVEFLDVVTDKGVPTPRFAVVLPDDLDIANYQIESLESDPLPPGTILCFNQVGNAQENAERIVAQSRKRSLSKLFMRRSDG
jgi:hypothetical protein